MLAKGVAWSLTSAQMAPPGERVSREVMDENVKLFVDAS